MYDYYYLLCIYLGSFGGRFLPKILKRSHLQQGEMYHSFIPVARTAQHELAVPVESGCGWQWCSYWSVVNWTK